MNVTLSADQDLLEKARRYAQQHGTSLNQLFRDYLQQLTGDVGYDEAAAEFASIARTKPGNSKGRAWSGRVDLYRDRLESIANR
ncbi:MAG: hypothetical protein EA382_17525 [Spirochaetaceae bacterium]|nr:MAG: hypothetical protein EA382_17525 [Spirochaetaceae bacterium]